MWDHVVTLASGCPLLPSKRYKGDNWGFIALLNRGQAQDIHDIGKLDGLGPVDNRPSTD